MSNPLLELPESELAEGLMKLPEFFREKSLEGMCDTIRMVARQVPDSREDEIALACTVMATKPGSETSECHIEVREE